MRQQIQFSFAFARGYMQEGCFFTHRTAVTEGREESASITDVLLDMGWLDFPSLLCKGVWRACKGQFFELQIWEPLLMKF